MSKPARTAPNPNLLPKSRGRTATRQEVETVDFDRIGSAMPGERNLSRQLRTAALIVFALIALFIYLATKP